MIYSDLGLLTAVEAGFPGHKRLWSLWDQWTDDSFEFIHHDVPKIVAVLLIAFILTRLLKLITRRLSHLSKSDSLPSGVRAQQIRTLSGVVYSMGVFIVAFLAAMQILPLFGINMGPLLASAGVAGLAIGFGAQTLVKDVVTGFFILVENQYEVGDTIKIADRTGVVELMSLRRTILRDGDGSLHIVPNSSIAVVTNFTRDWTQIAMHVSVAYNEPSEKITRLLQEVGTELQNDPALKDSIVGTPDVPGIEKITGQEVDYLMLVKTKPGQQYTVSRELRRRIKECFQKNNVQPGWTFPGLRARQAARQMTTNIYPVEFGILNFEMWWSALIDGGIALSLFALWYFSWKYWLRRRSRLILGWIQLAFRRHGKVSEIQWHSPSRFQVDLHLRTATFRQAHLVVQLAPRELPFNWLWYRLRNQQETATFAADLDSPPAFNLDVRNHRWCGTDISAAPHGPRKWSAERLGPIVITTRRDWQHEIVNMMDALAASRSYDFLRISFRKSEPHFSATVALNAMEPDALADINVFDVIRELATSSSPSAF